MMHGQKNIKLCDSVALVRFRNGRKRLWYAGQGKPRNL